MYDRLRKASLTANIEKCEFCLPRLKNLGFVVDREGLRTDPDKMKARVNFPRPTTSIKLKDF